MCNILTSTFIFQYIYIYIYTFFCKKISPYRHVELNLIPKLHSIKFQDPTLPDYTSSTFIYAPKLNNDSTTNYMYIASFGKLGPCIKACSLNAFINYCMYTLYIGFPLIYSVFLH